MDAPTTPSSRKTYIIISEIDKDDTRNKVVQKLREYSGYCPLTPYSWAITTTKSATEIRDDVVPVIDQESDRLYIFRAGNEGAWRRSMSDKHSAWLKKYI